jgi:hypothetical protein
VRRLRDDDGQVTLLAILFTMLALLLVTAVVSATGIHLERKRLLALADALSLEAADALSPATVYADPERRPQAGAAVPLTDRDVTRAVDRYLHDNPTAAAGFAGLSVQAQVSDDGRTAEITLGALARPTILSWVTAPWSDGIALQVESSARAW